MRAVVYARVSTEHEAQINALENQLEWYKIEASRHSTGKLQRSMWIRASQERRRRKGRSSYV